MPSILGIPLIGFIQMVLGTGIIVFFIDQIPDPSQKEQKGRVYHQ